MFNFKIVDVIKLLNDNQGIISIAIFIITLLLGWISGIFSALQKKPKFKIDLIDGPSFCCTFNTGKECFGHDVHTTAFSLYLNISNIGSAPSSIQKIYIGYHWDLEPFSINWLKYKIGWFWLKHETVISEDFRVDIGNDNVKLFPFLTQKNSLLPMQVDKFLNIGKAVNGIVYFEQPESWGAQYPLYLNGKVKIKVKVFDVFGKSHSNKLKINLLNLEQASKFNPAFGSTHSSLARLKHE